VQPRYVTRSCLLRVTRSWVVSVIMVLCLGADLVLHFMYDVHLVQWFFIFDNVMLGFLVLELLVRLVALGPVRFVRSAARVMDALMLFVSVFITLFLVFSKWNRIFLVGVRFFFRLQLGLHSTARRVVSQNKLRYQMHGFDLDLSYITPRCIAMGLPSKGIESLYRNPISMVIRFFDKLHCNRFLIFNLCEERSYDPALFANRVQRIPFFDHNPPRLCVMAMFCRMAEAFLSLSKDNVIAIHCKGGKGRTGVMVCCYLMYSDPQRFPTPAAAMNHFSQGRSDTEIYGGDTVGVDGPSQVRYLECFHHLLTCGLRAGEHVLRRVDGLTTGDHDEEVVPATNSHLAR